MKIPITRLLRGWREKSLETGKRRHERWLLGAWAFFARRPRLYHLATRFAVATLSALGRPRGAFKRLPLAGGWTARRDFPAPQGRTFQQLWAEHQRGVPR